MRWTDRDKLAQALEENYPEEDLEDLTTNGLKDLVITLSDFEDDPEDVTKRILELIKEEWANIREKI